ncbi:hypothetical protein EJB05_47440, partial [Eragrostis curvula]
MEKSPSPFEDNAHTGDKIEELAPVALCDTIKNPLRRILTEEQKDARRARDRARYAKMTPEQKKARRGKMSEEQLTESQKDARRAIDRARYAKMTPEQKKARKEQLTKSQKDAIRARDRARYAKMTPDQKKTRRGKMSEEQKNIKRSIDKARHAKRSEEQRQAKRLYDSNHFAKIYADQRMSKVEKNKSIRKRRREEEGLFSESIAMENPFFAPDLVFPDGSAQAKSNPKPASDPSDISMLGPTWKPLNIPPVPDQSHNNDEDNSSNKACGARHQRVTHGERQALRSRRNEQFHKPKNPLDPSLEEDHSLTDDEIAGCQTTEKDDN